MSKVDGKQIKDAPNGVATSQINANAVTSAKVDSSVLVSSGANPATGDLNLGSHKLTSVATPTASGDAATKGYVDALVSGLKVVAPVLILFDANVASKSGEKTQDGVTTSLSRVILTAQSTASENGPWVTAAGAWARPSDYVAGNHAAGTLVVVEEGNTYSDQQWICTTDPPSDVIDTNNTTWVKFSSQKGPPRPAKGGKNLTASATTTDNDLATATTVPTANANAGYMGVRVNGLHALVGDGTKTSVDCYFSGDGGTTARAMSAIAAGDTLRWNGSVAGYQLSATDIIDFVYEEFF